MSNITQGPGVSAQYRPKNNLTSDTSPGDTDDSTEGYGLGSLWVDGVDNAAYICTDPTPGAAVWLSLAGGGGGGGVTTLGNFGSSPNAKGGTIASTTLTLQPADDTHPGGVAVGAQTFGGAKTFPDGVVGNVTGNVSGSAATATLAAAATVLATPRNINGVAFDGSADITVSAPGSGNYGYLNIPQDSESADYTLVIGDSGKHIYHPSSDNNARTFTIPSNASVAFPLGTVVTFINDAATSATIAITTDTLVLAGTGTTGSRTLAQYGMATAIKVTSTRWIINGTGLT